jgi:hypothetical protein
MAQPQERQPREMTADFLTQGIPLALLVVIWLAHIRIPRWLLSRLHRATSEAARRFLSSVLMPKGA